jgi:exodeoxyribonuclease V gamma subunit
MREVEVLYDNILNFFDTIPDLKPSEIIVMAPDIELYAPFIKTVFGSPQNVPLPYTLADRAIKDESTIAEGFMELLDILNSRFTSISIINLLEIDEVRENFDISLDDLSLIKIWIKKVGIRWSLDAESKKKYSLPQTAENSWKSGLDQLLLGFALPAQDISLFDGVAGSNLIEGSAGEVLGKFLNFFTGLSNLHVISEKSFSLEEWSAILLKTLGQFFSANLYKQHEITNISQILSALVLQQQLSDFDEPVQFEVIKAYLKLQFTGTSISSVFLNGGITFCSMLPMRGIPFRILCLLGMNEGAFPRKSHHVSWDLIAASPRKGDRLVEAEDRYIFLEALLSARDVFYMSFIGLNTQKDINQHPSVCVEELLDYIATRYSLSTTTPAANQKNELKQISIREQLTLNHRLHPFNPEYFQPVSRLFSYSTESLKGAKRLLGNKPQPLPFFDIQLSTSPAGERQLTIEELVRFFVNPSKYLLQNRLNIFFSSPDEEILSTESFDIAGLEKYDISDKIFKSTFDHEYTKESLFDFYKALNLLPHGKIGQFTFNQVYSDVNEFSKKVSNYTNNSKLDDLGINFTFKTHHLKGQLTSIQQDCMLLFRNATAKPKDYLNAWIRHLCLNTHNSTTYPNTTIMVAKDTVVKFSPVPNADELLYELINEYLNGLLEPLKFFPQCSWEYATALEVEKKSSEEAYIKAYKSWHNDNKFSFSQESEDPYIQLCFSQKDPIDKVFEMNAIKIYNPLLKSMLQTSGNE